MPRRGPSWHATYNAGAITQACPGNSGAIDANWAILTRDHLPPNGSEKMAPRCFEWVNPATDMLWFPCNSAWEDIEFLWSV